ncbi:cupin domain-containing protein [Arenibaculum sp.]|uniref:cupin domain-containing protein n=1 Tax=Arenibaculum sp. TaxID=2865862 RepID=UPI002E0F5E56|nr:cupin domain-containing protein [Arenibaculum sp.]
MTALPTHHPDPDMLLGYAGGGLREAKAAFVATHLAFCPACRSVVAGFEAHCGRLLEALPEAGTGTGTGTGGGGGAGGSRLDAMLDRVLALLDEAAPEPAPAGPAPAGDVPLPLRGWRGFPCGERAWNWIAPGVALSEWTVEAAGTRACLLRMEPGAPVPAHRHTAEELLLVLTGSFVDEYGTYGLGDVAAYRGGTEHHAAGGPDATCVCLFMLDGDIVFLG